MNLKLKRVCFSLLCLLSVTFTIEACYPEHPRKTFEADGIYYAFEDGKWLVAGFKQEQDSIVLKNQVVIEGKKENIETIYIDYYYMNWYPTTSPRVLVIPEGFKAIVSLYLPKLEKLYLPKTIVRTHDVCTCIYANIHCENLRSIEVDKQNKYLKSVEGVLFSKDGKNLFLYPSKRQGDTYVIPKSVKYILLGAFDKCQLETIYLPKSKKEITSYYQFGYGRDTKDMLEAMGFSDAEKIKFIGKN